MDIKRIHIHELKKFVDSDEFKSFLNVPITTFRADSYINNPNARAEDPALFMLFDNNKLVAYRSVFADCCRNKNELIRFAWCSGSWVLPEYRRKGFSALLLEEVYKAWNGKLMFANYAPESLNLYLKSGYFKSIYCLQGKRFYLFVKSRNILQNRFNLKNWQYSTIDFILGTAASVKSLFYQETYVPGMTFKEKNLPDEECLTHLEKLKSQSFFQRGKLEYQWILKHSWISKTDDQFVGKYNFSSFSTDFAYHTIKMYAENKFVGLFIFQTNNRQLKFLLAACENIYYRSIASYLVNYSVQNKIAFLTILNSLLATEIQNINHPFINIREMNSNIYSSFEVDTDGLIINDADGDYIFS